MLEEVNLSPFSLSSHNLEVNLRWKQLNSLIVNLFLFLILHFPIAGQDNLVFASNTVLEEVNLSPFSLSSHNLEVNLRWKQLNSLIVNLFLFLILHFPIAGQDNLVFASNSVLEKINLSPFSLSSHNLEVNSDGNS